ncbi:GNAT family N-acetyltransferase [Dokdonella soli]|uniref:GNAT family N-acetyltransferase n=1 Tax=Dokdonella soli TaxID=529810 RepID=A0ABN1IE84_9GAMM
MTAIETERLVLHRLVPDDAPFILELVNDPAWLRYIGDKGVRTLDDARAYITNGPVASYARHGFGLDRVELRGSATPIGICGLVKRDALPDADVGFAFLPGYRGQGFAYEAAAAVLRHAGESLKLPRIAAIVSPDNLGSIRVLEKLGLRFETTIRMAADRPETKLFGRAL